MKLKSSSYFNAKIDNRGRMMHYRDFGKTGMKTGVEPNPRLSTVVRAAELAKKEACDVVIGMGGGSVMDASKVIAASVLYEGDPKDMLVRAGKAPRLPNWKSH
jgi:hypothetical protein